MITLFVLEVGVMSDQSYYRAEFGQECQLIVAWVEVGEWVMSDQIWTCGAEFGKQVILPVVDSI